MNGRPPTSPRSTGARGPVGAGPRTAATGSRGIPSDAREVVAAPAGQDAHDRAGMRRAARPATAPTQPSPRQRRPRPRPARRRRARQLADVREVARRARSGTRRPGARSSASTSGRALAARPPPEDGLTIRTYGGSRAAHLADRAPRVGARSGPRGACGHYPGPPCAACSSAPRRRRPRPGRLRLLVVGHDHRRRRRRVRRLRRRGRRLGPGEAPATTSRGRVRRRLQRPRAEGRSGKTSKPTQPLAAGKTWTVRLRPPAARSTSAWTRGAPRRPRPTSARSPSAASTTASASTASCRAS